ncbi:hypothetical protein BofuT4_uP133110.1 [Botrytis cinerea T4]|uniref:Uncharacterized protein n=1 Tax=Botryotinia fuckeliana (strain T4) TaxID=999810 RepID=G2YQ59_BOTF4|nr:hypothetical protein BofuT4_uP133110.1 [Botrytis cinerea T4]
MPGGMRRDETEEQEDEDEDEDEDARIADSQKQTKPT